VSNLNVVLSHFAYEKLFLNIPSLLIIPISYHSQVPNLRIKMCESSLFLLFSFSCTKGTKFPIFIVPFGCPSQLGFIGWFCGQRSHGGGWALLYWVSFVLLGMDSFNIVDKISFFLIFVLEWVFFFSFVFRVNWNLVFFFFELVIMV